MKRNYEICSITGIKYGGYGNNAYPFEGRCCDYANTQYVIPARVMGITPEAIKALTKEAIKKYIDLKWWKREDGVKN